MRFDVRHITSFTYDGEVAESQNELRACPATDRWQQLLHYRVSVDPGARTHGWSDYWGTHVDAFGIRVPHARLTVMAEATVETTERPTPTGAAPMQALLDPTFRDEHFEFLQTTKATRLSDHVADEARALVAGAGTVLEAAAAIATRVGSALSYEPGATFVGTTAEEAIEAEAGVCQDFAHVAVAMARAAGIPSRYVSGYLFTQDDESGDDTDRREVVVQTHAWFECAVPGDGWVAWDPTNRQDVGTRHIVIGRGRDYHDVPPLRGTYVGEDDAELEVEVHLRRLTAAEQQQQ